MSTLFTTPGGLMELLTNIWGFFRAGGPIMAPLFLVALWMWILIVMKFIWLRKIRKREKELDWALPYLEGKDAHPPEGGDPWSRAVRVYTQLSVGVLEQDRCWWQFAVFRELPGFSRHVSLALALAGVAPLLGLLGTVSGMIKTFEVMCIFGTGNVQAMAGGIKEALFTTEMGLLVAIPGFFVGMGLKRGARGVLRRFLAFCETVEIWIEAEGSQKA